ncbi:MAG: farnesyl diphosphate synthase [Pseudomonadota bacterium]|nr:farnesyl diphosphate synthase [Pseudomonadota bacterium]
MMTRKTPDVTEPTIEQRLTPYRDRLEAYLNRALPTADTIPTVLHEALRYSTLNAGKRLRACLVYLTGDMLNATPAALDAPAAAIELIHAYSLVHDDLPCMDDDDLRRGKPSCHKAYDEATAMLVGDALQSLAFELLGSVESSDMTLCPRLVRTLAKAAGSLGMVGGQALDLAAEGKDLELSSLQQIHAMKTAALIEAAVLMGAQTAGVSDSSQLQLLSDYGRALGLGFQILDDILDVVSDTETLGKQAGADEINSKATYPGLMGLAAARKSAESAHQQASAALNQLPFDTQNLQMLADYAINRIY